MKQCVWYLAFKYDTKHHKYIHLFESNLNYFRHTTDLHDVTMRKRRNPDLKEGGGLRDLLNSDDDDRSSLGVGAAVASAKSKRHTQRLKRKNSILSISAKLTGQEVQSFHDMIASEKLNRVNLDKFGLAQMIQTVENDLNLDDDQIRNVVQEEALGDRESRSRGRNDFWIRLNHINTIGAETYKENQAANRSKKKKSKLRRSRSVLYDTVEGTANADEDDSAVESGKKNPKDAKTMSKMAKRFDKFVRNTVVPSVDRFSEWMNQPAEEDPLQRRKRRINGG